MSTGFRDTVHQQMRETILDVAATEVITRGWRGLQMSTVAAGAGVSRQTLYNAFSHKHGLAQALVLRLADKFLDGVEHAARNCAGLAEQWEAAARRALEAAVSDPLLSAVLSNSGSDEFLRLLTSEGTPVLRIAYERLVTVFSDLHPELDRGRLGMASDAAVRLCLSHIVLPQFSIPQSAAQVANLVTSYLASHQP